MDIRQFFVSRANSFVTSLSNIRDLRRLRRFLPITILSIAVLLVLGGTGWLVMRSRANDNRVQVQGAKAKQDINKEFPIPIRDNDNKEITKIKMNLETAELRDEIIVQGKRASSVKGRTFLILSLKLTNDFDKGVQMNVKDYFRLTVNGNEGEMVAADIHNDPVVIQPKSTKFSRIGFPINDTDKKLVLWVGEISGDKQKLELNLKWTNIQMSPSLPAYWKRLVTP